MISLITGAVMLVASVCMDGTVYQGDINSAQLADPKVTIDQVIEGPFAESLALSLGYASNAALPPLTKGGTITIFKHSDHPEQVLMFWTRADGCAYYGTFVPASVLRIHLGDA